MKKLFSVLLAAVMLLSVVTMALPASAETTTVAKTVYVSDSGNDTNAGTKDAPVATLLKAYQLLGAEGGVVSIVGTLTIVKDVDENADYRALCKNLMNAIGKVTITSEDGTGKLSVESSGIWFPGATELSNLVLYAARTNDVIFLVGNCHPLVIGENVTVEKAEAAPDYPVIYGSGMYSVMGWFGDANTSTDVVIKSGKWSKVYGGGCTYHSDWGLVDDVKGNASVTVEGGEITELYGGGAGGGNGILTIKGDVTVDVKGGTVGKLIANNGNKDAVIEGKATVTVTGGTVNEIKVNSFDGDDKITGATLLKCTEAYKSLATGFETVEVIPEKTYDGKVIYVSDGGNDENAGTKDAPVATLLKAYQLLGAEGGTVSIVENLTVVKDVDENTDYRALCKNLMNAIGKVTITSDDGKGKLTVQCSGIWLPGDTEFTDLLLYADYKAYNIYLVGNCHQLVIGENVAVELAEGAPGYPIIYGSGMYSVMGWFGDKNTSTDVIVKSGIWQDVYAGGCTYHSDWGLVDDVKGNACVTVEGGTITNLYGGGAGGGNGILTINGDVTVNVKGGTIGKVIANNASKDAMIEGNVTVNITGGTIGEITANSFNDDYRVLGKITLNCNDEYRALATNFPTYAPEDNTTTEAPTTTEEPGATTTEKPVTTTEKPATTTEKPEAPTQEVTSGTSDNATQEAGCGSFVGGSIAIILAIAGGAMLIARNKED